MGFVLEVECYAGHKADEPPLRFRFVSRHAGDHSGVPAHPEISRGEFHEVRDILDQWYGVGYQCFKVRAEDGNLYILRHNTEEEGAWTLDSFRRESV
jgi:hypothetical protein